ncbi:MAG: hypothetical protein D0433_14765 [Candidatus Thermochlorobacter aerophilum]|jgi:hypothetical protein|uniref:Uncharacterized protein n=1 Tax=Candidatus Thermochlorobacter aerophilus TaxID=1868324 RepID=A0A395LV74_9BACT|nr:MAG: hypothetical protein D0433_14765 [Candidatus Thermochlorobacter aerophilum]
MLNRAKQSEASTMDSSLALGKKESSERRNGVLGMTGLVMLSAAKHPCAEFLTAFEMTLSVLSC